jgi:HD-like signal output (HDOD) protein
MNTWHGYTPDGRKLVVRREADSWVVRCGANESRNWILDVALIEAIRTDHDLSAHAREIEYAAWVRAQAARIEEELGQEP